MSSLRFPRHARMALAAVMSATLSAPASALAAQVAVWNVDVDGSGDFTQIQAAVDAAADGDVIVVAPGAYAPFRISGKGLRLHAQVGATVFNTTGPAVEAVLVEGTAAHQSVVLDGLQVLAFAPGSPSTVHVDGCAGPVWLQGVFSDSYGTAALHVEASDSVVLDRCLLQSNLSTPSATGVPQPQPGARIDAGARVFAYDTQFRGTHGPLVMGGVPAVTEPEDGGPGLLLVDSEARLAGCSLAGGAGSLFDTGACLTGGDGGDGALLLTAGGSPPLLVVASVAVQPGPPPPSQPGCGAPAAGQAFDVPAGGVLDLAQPARLVAVEEGAAQAGTTVHVELRGAPGDLCLVFASGAVAPALALPGAPAGLHLHLAPAPLVLVHSTALTTAAASLALPSPALPPGVFAATPALQGLFVDPQGGLHASTPHALTLLAP